MNFRSMLAAFTILGVFAGPGEGAAAELRVAVASNFSTAMAELAERFEATTGHEIILSSGSTGKLYAQIVQGAPYDLYFAADAARPEKLERDGRAVAGSRFTYAVGELVLWSPDPQLVDDAGKVLDSGEFRFLAIANPDLAPYGRAAREVMQNLGLWNRPGLQLVRGENIGQVFQFVHSGNAELGFVAGSQIIARGDASAYSAWRVPQELYAPIRQQAVALADSAAAVAFVEFMRSEKALRLIEQYGYLRP